MDERLDFRLVSHKGSVTLPYFAKHSSLKGEFLKDGGGILRAQGERRRFSRSNDHVVPISDFKWLMVSLLYKAKNWKQ
jgi:hypothetical protein